MRFTRDGWFLAPGVGPRAVESLRALWAEVGPEHPGAFASTTRKGNPASLRRRVSEGIVGLLAPTAGALVPGYRAVSGCFMVKRAEGDPVRLHRHEALMDEGRHAGVLLWMPLQDTPRERGCMVVVPGTHRSRSLIGSEIPLSEEPPEAVEVPMRAGEVLVMDHRLVHGSRPNGAAEERLAVTLLLAPEGIPLWCCRRSARLLEVFEVPDDFYLRWVEGEPPVDAPPLFRFPL